MALDPMKKGYRHEKEQMLKLVNLTEQQAEIIEIYILEEQTGKKHWEMDPEDPNIYVEWLNGTNKLRSRINNLSNMTRQQKAIYNSGIGQNTGNNNDNSTQKTGQQKTITASSGRVLDPTTAPNLFRNKGHNRRGR
jgi:hypothetical protein